MLSVIRQKGKSQNGCFQKTKHVQFSVKRTFLTPPPPETQTYVCVSGGKKCSFFGKFGVLYFFETPVLRFALLPYYRRCKPFVEKLKKWSLSYTQSVAVSKLIHHLQGWFALVYRKMQVATVTICCIQLQQRIWELAWEKWADVTLWNGQNILT